MTQTFQADSNNDITRGTDGNISVLSGINAVSAACKSAAQAQLGEMVLAITSGIPNFQTVWIGTPNYAIFSSYLRTTFEGIDGVVQVNDIIISAKDNTLFYTADITTIYGNGKVNGQFIL